MIQGFRHQGLDTFLAEGHPAGIQPDRFHI